MKIRPVVVNVIVFILAGGFAFFCEDKYEQIIRGLYSHLSHGKIYFISGKYFHLPTYGFILSFAVFCLLLSIGILQKNSKFVMLSLFIFILIFFFGTWVCCYFGSFFDLVECDMCHGTRALAYDNIDYNGIFIGNLVMAYLSFIIFNKLTNKKKTT